MKTQSIIIGIIIGLLSGLLISSLLFNSKSGRYQAYNFDSYEGYYAYFSMVLDTEKGKFIGLRFMDGTSKVICKGDFNCLYNKVALEERLNTIKK